jgi:hypothetical protein
VASQRDANFLLLLLFRIGIAFVGLGSCFGIIVCAGAENPRSRAKDIVRRHSGHIPQAAENSFPIGSHDNNLLINVVVI